MITDRPVLLLNEGALVTPLAEPEGRAGEPASFRELAPPTWVIWRLTGKKTNLKNKNRSISQSISYVLIRCTCTWGLTESGSAGADGQCGRKLHGGEGGARLGGAS